MLALTPQIVEQLIEKWENKGFKMKELSDPLVRKNMAILLENEHSYITEAGSTMSTDIADFKKILMPLTRRIFPNLLANEIVGVQPMAGPTSLAYALRFRAAQDYSGQTSGYEIGYNTIDKQYTGSTGTTYSGAQGTCATTYGADTSAAERWSSGLGGPGNDDPSSLQDMPEARLSIEQVTVTAKTRKLKARYSLEAAQDLKNVHGLDVEAEMTNMLQYEVAAEIDRELVDLINMKGALWGYTYTVTGSTFQWEAEALRNVYTRMVKAAGDIAVRTRRGAGNFIIASSNVVTALDSLGTFLLQPLAGANPMELNPGVAKVGSIENRFAVYRDTFATSDYATIGFKGAGPHNSGIIYCPYVPLMISRAVEPGAFYPVIGVMTRYGLVDHLFGADLFYTKIAIDFTGIPSMTQSGYSTTL